MKRSGFTLVELLIVMAVIAAVISVVAPMGLNALKQARTVQVATDLRAVMNTVIGKVAAYGKFVTSVAGTYDKDHGGYKTAIVVATSGTSAYTLTVSGWGEKFDAEYLKAAFGADFNAGVLTVSVSDYIYNN